MIPEIPFAITSLVFVTALAAGVGAWVLLFSGARRAGLSPEGRRAVRLGTGAFLAAWFLAVLLLAPAPASVLRQDPFTVTPLIPLFATLPVVAAALAIWRSSSFRRALDAASVPAMIGVQVYRTVGVAFLVLLALGEVPAHFALPAGWGDIAVGLAAPWVALALARGSHGARTAAVAWNVIGLLDLVVAVGMGTGLLAALVVPELGSRVPAAAAMGVFPMFLVPAFTVPISVMLHVVALRGLLRHARWTASLAPAAR